MNNLYMHCNTYEAHIWGIAGSLGSGKTTFAKSLTQYFSKPIHIIEIDDIRRYLLWFSVEKEHIELREKLGRFFNLKTVEDEHWLNRETFTQIIFSSQHLLTAFSKIVTPFIKNHIQRMLRENKKQDVFLVWNYLVEESYTEFVNEFVILVDTKTDIILERLDQQNDTAFETLSQRLALQPSIESRIQILKTKSIPFVVFNNDEDLYCEQFSQILKDIHV